jgi:hypothetical protein
MVFMVPVFIMVGKGRHDSLGGGGAVGWVQGVGGLPLLLSKGGQGGQQRGARRGNREAIKNPQGIYRDVACYTCMLQKKPIKVC